MRVLLATTAVAFMLTACSAAPDATPTPVGVDPFLDTSNLTLPSEAGAQLGMSSTSTQMALPAAALRSLPHTQVSYADTTHTPQSASSWSAVPLLALSTFLDSPLPEVDTVVLVEADGDRVEVNRDELAAHDLCLLVPDSFDEGDLDPYVVASMSDAEFSPVAVAALEWR